MKKLFLFCLLFLIGCTGKQEKLNIYKLSEELEKLETDSLNIEEALVTVTEEVIETELDDMSLDMSKYIDLSKLKQYMFYQNDDTFVFIYETDDINIKTGIKKYFDDILDNQITASLREKIVNRIEYQYEDFYIYIVGDKKDEILEKVLDTKILLFNNTAKLSEDAVLEKFDVKIEDAIVKWSTKLEEEYGYLLIEKPSSEIEAKCDAYFDKNKDKLTGELLKLNKDENLIYVVSQDNNKVLETIENMQTTK